MDMVFTISLELLHITLHTENSHIYTFDRKVTKEWYQTVQL